MNTDLKLKVLWVDDDESILDAFISLAEEYGIYLDYATNWEEAEIKLKLHFKEYSAIILDAQCKIKKMDSVPSSNFLGHAITRLSRICGEKQELIPWYILSAGTMKNLDIVKQFVNEERKTMEPIWGQMFYFKDSEKGDACDLLFKKIVKVAPNRAINKVICRHSTVLKYLGEGNLIKYSNARIYILKMLSALYNPEDNLNYQYEGNPLRKVLEYIFRTALDYGLLSEDYVNENGNIVLLEASRFMAGLTPMYSQNKDNLVTRFGNPGKNPNGSGGDTIFNDEIARIVKNVLEFSNIDSHTEEKETYTIDNDKKEIFFSYVLQLCHVIKWFGRYLEEHSNIEENLAKHRKVHIANDKSKSKNQKSNKVHALKENEDIPKMETLLGQEGIVLYDGHVAKFGKYCKVEPSLHSYIGKKVRIIAISECTDSSDKEIEPYIITDVVEIKM